MHHDEGNARWRWVLVLAVLCVLALLFWKLGSPVENQHETPLSSVSSSDVVSVHSDASGATAWRSRLVVAPVSVVTGTAVVLDGGTEQQRSLLSGAVFSAADGTPVAGASLSFEHRGVTRSTHTQADGTFRFTPTEEGEWSLVALTAEGYESLIPANLQRPMAFQLRSNVRIESVTFTLVPESSFVVVVRDEEGAAIAGATVQTLDAVRAQTNAQGEATLNITENAVLSVRANGFVQKRMQVGVASWNQRRLPVVLERARVAQATSDARLTGIVQGEDRVGLDGVLLRLWQMDDASNAPRALGRTGPDGRFALTELEAGSYELEVYSVGLIPVRLRVQTGVEVSVQLRSGGQLRGVVREGRSGSVVTAFTVIARLVRGPFDRGPALVQSFFDAQGRFVLRGIEEGSHELVVVADGYASSTVPSVRAGEQEIEVRLSRGGSVFGVVRDAVTRTPIEGARVALEGVLDGNDGIPVRATARSDAEGRFRLEGVPAGMRGLLVSAAGHHSRVLSGFVMGAEGTVGPLEALLTPVAQGERPGIELAGIAAVLSGQGDGLVVRMVLEGGGAERAGVRVGDVVLAVDGEDVRSLGFEGAIQRIRGPEGTTVQLRIRRGDSGVFDVVAERRRVRT